MVWVKNIRKTHAGERPKTAKKKENSERLKEKWTDCTH